MKLDLFSLTPNVNLNTKLDGVRHFNIFKGFWINFVPFRKSEVHAPYLNLTIPRRDLLTKRYFFSKMCGNNNQLVTKGKGVYVLFFLLGKLKLI